MPESINDDFWNDAGQYQMDIVEECEPVPTTENILGAIVK